MTTEERESLPGSSSSMALFGFLIDCPNFEVRLSLGTFFKSFAPSLGIFPLEELASLSELLFDLKLKTDALLRPWEGLRDTMVWRGWDLVERSTDGGADTDNE